MFRAVAKAWTTEFQFCSLFSSLLAGSSSSNNCTQLLVQQLLVEPQRKSETLALCLTWLCSYFLLQSVQADENITVIGGAKVLSGGTWGQLVCKQPVIRHAGLTVRVALLSTIHHSEDVLRPTFSLSVGPKRFFFLLCPAAHLNLGMSSEATSTTGV